LIRIIIGLLSVTLAPAVAQSDPFAPLVRLLEGKWEGSASGNPGKGVSSREYRLELGRRYMSALTKSVYEPKTPEAKPEVHEDRGIFSYDKALKKIVLRQFHIEGFVNTYLCELGDPNGEALTCVTRETENIPAGWRAREVYRVVGPDAIEELFSLAPPNKDFELYSRTRLKRVR